LCEAILRLNIGP